MFFSFSYFSNFGTNKIILTDASFLVKTQNCGSSDPEGNIRSSVYGININTHKHTVNNDNDDDSAAIDEYKRQQQRQQQHTHVHRRTKRRAHTLN